MDTQVTTVIISLAILLMSVVIHEISHGYVAYLLGDPTAKLAGRLTLNPLKHLDPIGSIIVPIVTSVAGFTFGWAKPVPYNPYNLQAGKWGPAAVAAAGPLSNLFIALVFGLSLRFGLVTGPAQSLIVLITFVNIILAVFNLIPIPPLDGSKVFFSLLSYRYAWLEEFMSKNYLLLVILLLWVGGGILSMIAGFVFSLITGISIF
ncbi:MAG: site-2 protease family protein [Candidatus Vogelbacteria bacterium]|nr:site-2 protease family protein [Candidatus Vogelbacteria bacterium]